MSHTMKLWEHIIENSIRVIVEFGNIQFGFRKGMSTTEPIFALRIQEKYQERMVFADLDGFRAKQGKTESEMKSSGATQWSNQSPHMSPRNAFRGMAM